MAYLGVGTDAAIALLIAEAVSGHWLESARKGAWNALTVTAAALLVVCIGVEVDLAVVREHAAAQARIDTAVKEAHDRAVKDLDTEEAEAAAPTAAAGPSIQLDGLDRKSARALGQGLAKGQQETAAQQEGFRKERAAHREIYIQAREQEARQRASQTDPGEMIGQVGMAVVYAVATALAAGAVGEFLGAMQRVLERLLGLPGAFIGWCRPGKAGAP
jgi:hypothetical protein